MSTEWYYSQGGQQIGPVTSQQMKDLAAGGQLSPNDLVWKDGMPEWTSAARVRGLFPGAGGGVATAAAPQPGYAQPGAYAQPAPGNADYAYAQQAQGGQIGYYSATSDINERTRRILANIPPVTGPRGDWPLSDHHLAQFAATEAYRKPIRGFNTMCRIMMILFILSTVYFLIMLSVIGSRNLRGDLTPIMISVAVQIGLAVLYPLAGSAAMRCRIWGPISIIVVNSLAAVLVMIGLIQMTTSSFRIRGEEILIMLIPLVLIAILIVISVRALTHTSKFLNGPVWCVEAMINARQ
ncbi:MAG: DUF4339 domain-containing protein [Phycisphaerae bacterium]|nr:DUF4339 domain-containing protein [Tepidisphaeraceae bacterium]